MRVDGHRPAVGIGQRDLILSDPAAGTSPRRRSARL